MSGVIYSIADEANANGSKNAYVITNNHVIEGSCSIYTYLYGDNYTVDSILPSALETTNVGSSKTEDIAVLSVEIPEDRLDFVQAVSAAVGTRDSDTAKVGEKIYAIGNPLGYGISVLSGSVSVEVENEYVVSRLSMRIDAPVTHGSSGGGLFDREGRGATYCLFCGVPPRSIKSRKTWKRSQRTFPRKFSKNTPRRARNASSPFSYR